jgi:hypothetical protein
VKRFENHKAPTKKKILNQKVINEGEASMDQYKNFITSRLMFNVTVSNYKLKIYYIYS